jgi:hypothetical protein
MDYAEACNMLNDEVSEACGRAERRGLTTLEVVEELRRIANEIESEAPGTR